MSSSSARRGLSGGVVIQGAGIQSPAVHSRRRAHRITSSEIGAQLKRSPAQVYALIFGAVLTISGIVGFFYSADFSTGDAVKDPANQDKILGIFAVNGWTNVFLI